MNDSPQNNSERKAALLSKLEELKALNHLMPYDAGVQAEWWKTRRELRGIYREEEKETTP